MQPTSVKKVLTFVLIAAGLWLGIRFVLPVVLPFVLGALLAVFAEPMVAFGAERLRLPRTLAAGVGVSFSVLFLAVIVTAFGAVLVRQLGNLAGEIPNLEMGVQTLQDWLLTAADKAPDGIRTLAQKTVLETFDDSAALMEQMTGRIPALLTTLVSGLGNSLLGIGTGVLAAFFISARLPQLRETMSSKIPKSWKEKYLPVFGRVRSNLGGWLKAQGKLALVTWGIVTLGFWVLGISRPLLWAGLVALVDAVPILGTGTVLIPWALISLLMDNKLHAIGLFCTYGAAAITRTVLEPRVVGRQLGIDPLMTLISLYTGYRLWGIPGLLLTPILVSALKCLVTSDGNS